MMCQSRRFTEAACTATSTCPSPGVGTDQPWTAELAWTRLVGCSLLSRVGDSAAVVRWRGPVLCDEHESVHRRPDGLTSHNVVTPRRTGALADRRDNTVGPRPPTGASAYESRSSLTAASDPRGHAAGRLYFPRAQLQVVANGRREGCAPGGGSLSRSGTPAEPNGGVVGLRTPNGGWLSRRPANAGSIDGAPETGSSSASPGTSPPRPVESWSAERSAGGVWPGRGQGPPDT